MDFLLAQENQIIFLLIYRNAIITVIPTIYGLK